MHDLRRSNNRTVSKTIIPDRDHCMEGRSYYIYLYFVVQTAATQYTDKKRIKEMDAKRTHTSLKPK